ncbi:MAG: hypothetical protein BWK73_02065 [Thiothrix lacustris]|uniref:PAS fold-4 domain-containing protein n=2 Tax=Pseudomonadota TaxID=1224 RepID=A0A1Y1QYG2_9GAMM|nr:MAG: hypothetical protein BWK73_02065 [Thiothrix lacustris]
MNVPVSDVKPPLAAGPPGDPKALLRAMLDSVPDNVAVLDARGTIVMTNIAWRQYAIAYSPVPGQATPNSDVGVNYLEVSSRGNYPNDESGRRAVQGIRDVLSGAMEAFSLCYPCHTPDEQLWSTMTVTPLEWEGERGALVTHTDTTPRHRLNRR